MGDGGPRKTEIENKKVRKQNTKIEGQKRDGGIGMTKGGRGVGKLGTGIEIGEQGGQTEGPREEKRDRNQEEWTEMTD